MVLRIAAVLVGMLLGVSVWQCQSPEQIEKKFREIRPSKLLPPCAWINNAPLLSGSLVVSSAHQTLQGSFVCAIQKPSAFQLLLRGPLGIPLAIVAGDSNRFQYYDVLAQTLYETDSLRKIATAFAAAPQNAATYIRILIGCFDLQQWRSYRGSVDTLYRLHASVVERLIMDTTGLPREYQWRDHQSRQTFGVRYHAFRVADTLLYPQKLRLYLPEHSIQADIAIQQLQCGGEYDTTLFTIPDRGIRRVRL